MQGISHSDPQEVDEAFLTYYKNLLGASTSNNVQSSFINDIQLPSITQEMQDFLKSPITDADIKNSIFTMKKSSCGGPDGFNVTFYVSCWSVISSDVIKAVHNFFSTGRMLGAINSTNLALISKTDCPTNVTEFRPIACCNVIYKCISRILASRLKMVLQHVISRNQAAYLPKRNILDNVMLAHELLNGYSSKHISPRAMLKIDLRKAFDSVK